MRFDFISLLLDSYWIESLILYNFLRARKAFLEFFHTLTRFHQLPSWFKISHFLNSSLKLTKNLLLPVNTSNTQLNYFLIQLINPTSPLLSIPPSSNRPTFSVMTAPKNILLPLTLYLQCMWGKRPRESRNTRWFYGELSVLSGKALLFPGCSFSICWSSKN